MSDLFDIRRNFVKPVPFYIYTKNQPNLKTFMKKDREGVTIRCTVLYDICIITWKTVTKVLKINHNTCNVQHFYNYFHLRFLISDLSCAQFCYL